MVASEIRNTGFGFPIPNGASEETPANSMGVTSERETRASAPLEASLLTGSALDSTSPLAGARHNFSAERAKSS